MLSDILACASETNQSAVNKLWSGDFLVQIGEVHYSTKTLLGLLDMLTYSENLSWGHLSAPSVIFVLKFTYFRTFQIIILLLSFPSFSSISIKIYSKCYLRHCLYIFLNLKYSSSQYVAFNKNGLNAQGNRSWLLKCKEELSYCWKTLFLGLRGLKVTFEFGPNSWQVFTSFSPT